jgi:GWxTD domain-containing protein
MFRTLLLIATVIGIITLSVSWGFAQPKTTQMYPSEYYQMGVQERNAGNWQEALRIWMTAITDSNFVDPDPRLGIAFIELVTDKNLSNLYRSASLMYLWGFTTTDIERYADDIEQELERLQPLLEESTFRIWQSKLRNRDVSLMADIRLFWISIDPTPLQQPNGRLIEHWERIAYSRKNYTKNQSTVYGTDDRGLIYVRYGKPDRLKSGFLMPEETEVRGKLLELNSMTPEIREQGLESVFAQEQVSAMRAMYQPTEYEVWIYNIADKKGTSAFIFGAPGDGGRFGLRKSLDEFIPRRAFRTAIQSPGNNNYNQMVAGNLIEIGLYRDLASVDPFFADMFIELERSWSQYASGVMSAESYKSLAINTTAQNRLRENQRLLSQTRSDYERNYSPLLNSFVVYRVIDNTIPGFLIVNNTDPSIATAFDVGKMSTAETSRSYALRDALAVFDENMNLIDYTEKNPGLSIQNRTNVIESTNSSFFISSTESKAKNIRLSSELHRLGTEHMFRADKGAIIVGASNHEIILPGTLQTSSFEVSDIMLIDPRLASPEERPGYKILPQHRIKNGASLGMYFEVYNVPENNSGSRSYTVRYTISEPVRLRRNNRQRIQISANYVAYAESSNEILEIDTAKLKKGTYVCTMEFEISDKKIIREFEFIISD